MNSPTVISSFIAGMTRLNSTAPSVALFGRRCSITAALFWADRGSTWIKIGGSELEATEARLGGALFSEIERAFFKGVRVADHQYANEAEHAPKDRAALFNRIPIRDCPGIHKHDFEIEQDEEHRDYIKFNAEARLPFTLGNHAAFIGGVFGYSASSSLAYQDADEQRRNSKRSRNDDLQEHRQIVAQHPGSWPEGQFVVKAYFTPTR